MPHFMKTLNDTYSTTPAMAEILSDGRLLRHMAAFEGALAQAEALAALALAEAQHFELAAFALIVNYSTLQD